jgi:hypothetical protein
MHVLYTTQTFDPDGVPMEFRFLFEHTPGFEGSRDWPEQDEEFDLRQVCVRINGVGVEVTGETLEAAREWFGSPAGLAAASDAMARIEQQHAGQMAHERRAA